jgi:uncharacterized protein (DUF1697 family)
VTRYAAFLRGVMPTNCRMADLKHAFEDAGFTEVETVLGSGNVVFTAPRASAATLQRRAEAAMARRLDRTFLTIVRPVTALVELLDADPYRKFKLDAGSKRDVTFLREKPRTRLKLPVTLDDARILAMTDTEVFSTHVPNNPKGAVFMQLIERTLGKELTTRTWETVTKVARRGLGPG